MDGILATVRNGCLYGHSGETAAIGLSVLYAQILSAICEGPQFPTAVVMVWLETNPIMKDLCGEEGFPQFLGEFPAKLLEPAEEEVVT